VHATHKYAKNCIHRSSIVKGKLVGIAIFWVQKINYKMVHKNNVIADPNSNKAANLKCFVPNQ
jgi:hypothetical protein